MKTERHIDWGTEYPIIRWKGYEWQLDAEGHRKIHPDDPNEYYDDTAVRKDGNDIVLIVKDNPAEVSHWNGKTYESRFGRGMIYSVDTFSYGTYTLKCKFPKGKYVEPAFWLSSADSWPPEIDVFEGYAGCLGGYNQIPKRRIESNCHFQVYDDEGEEVVKNHEDCGGIGCSWGAVKNPLAVNEYKLVWTPDRIDVYYNNKRVRSFTEWEWPDIFLDLENHPNMHVIINTGLRRQYIDNYKVFDNNPAFCPKFRLIDFTYEPLKTK